jgi:hypothetical protein
MNLATSTQSRGGTFEAASPLMRTQNDDLETIHILAATRVLIKKTSGMQRRLRVGCPRHASVVRHQARWSTGFDGAVSSSTAYRGA